MNSKAHEQLKRWSLMGIFVIFAMAGLWHFLYKWLPGPVTAVLSPVNESPWEHTKLFFMPALIWYTIGYQTVGKAYPNFIFAYAAVLPLMPLLMFGIFYFIRMLGIGSLAVDLLNTLIVISLGLFLSYRLTVSKRRFSGIKYRVVSMAIVFAMLIIFAVLTYFPPHIQLFQDRNTLHYGIPLK